MFTMSLRNNWCRVVIPKAMRVDGTWCGNPAWRVTWTNGCVVPGKHSHCPLGVRLFARVADGFSSLHIRVPMCSRSKRGVVEGGIYWVWYGMVRTSFVSALKRTCARLQAGTCHPDPSMKIHLAQVSLAVEKMVHYGVGLPNIQQTCIRIRRKSTWPPCLRGATLLSGRNGAASATSYSKQRHDIYLYIMKPSLQRPFNKMGWPGFVM